MHTGALRYLYDETNKVAYTWQTYFSDSRSSDPEHYSLTVEDPAYQDDVLDAADGRPVEDVKALNLRLIVFAADVVRAAEAWKEAMLLDADARVRCVSNYSVVRLQVFNWTRR